jgi:hypothetical protein
MHAARQIYRKGNRCLMGRKAQEEALKRAQIIPSRSLYLELIGLQYFEGKGYAFPSITLLGEDLTIRPEQSL